MRNYVKAYKDVLKCRFAPQGVIRKHIENQETIDQYLPDGASFFYVIEIQTGKYHFMGKQQESVSGYTNEEFSLRGLQLLFENIHPDEVEFVVNNVYARFAKVTASVAIENRKSLQFQYNYRFRRKDGKYINLMEQVYILELDENGAPSMLLGNVIALDTTEVLPVRCSGRLIKSNQMSEIIFSKVYGNEIHPIEMITPREREILLNLSEGKTSLVIGEKLFISRHTVDTHRRNLLKKLGCKSTVELTRLAFRNGLL